MADVVVDTCVVDDGRAFGHVRDELLCEKDERYDVNVECLLDLLEAEIGNVLYFSLETCVVEENVDATVQSF